MGAGFNDPEVVREAEEDFSELQRQEVRKVKALIRRRNVLEKQSERDHVSDANLAEIGALEWVLDLVYYHRHSMAEFRKHREALDKDGSDESPQH